MAEKLRLLSLFAGIGGFELGLERSGGFQTVAQCEIDPFCNKVLAKHWPEVKRYGDIRELTAARLAADGIAVDAICGGFPCQDVSAAGQRAGLLGDRSSLWFEFARLIGEIRPRVVFVENVAELLDNGMGDVLGSLSSIGYDAEWHCIPASYVGAPHIRDRVWIVAHPSQEPGIHQSDRGKRASGLRGYRPAWLPGAWLAPEACLCRVEDGLPDRVDRTGSLGNAVVPQIPELLGRAWLEASHA